MTQHASPSPPREDSDASVPNTVRNEAADLATSAAERAGHVSDVVGGQAKVVVSETGRQARQLLEQAVDELRGQAREGQQKVAGGLRGLADQLHNMSERTESSGMASDVVRQLSERASSAASWLDSRDPADLVNELRDFARRRPGLFLTEAAVTGMLVGRLTRSIVTTARNNGSSGHSGTGPGRP